MLQGVPPGVAAGVPRREPLPGVGPRPNGVPEGEPKRADDGKGLMPTLGEGDGPFDSAAAPLGAPAPPPSLALIATVAGRTSDGLARFAFFL